MGKIPYVNEGELFVRTSYKCAEELLGEYNDFYIFNLAQYNNIYHKDDCVTEEKDCEIDEAKRMEIADRNAKEATDHFTALFGSKDFAESSMVGFRPAWYDLQQILLEEFKQKTSVKDSAMNGIAPYLRNVASTMLFAERIVSDMEKKNADPDALSVIKDGFRLLLERVEKRKVTLPEYAKTKDYIKKLKKLEQLIEFCDELFAGQYVPTKGAKK